MRRVTASLIALLAATALAAQEPPVPQERQHTVRPGETLTELAARYLGDAGRWRAIYEANRSVVTNPDLLRPDMVLTIPGHSRAAPTGRLAGVPLDGVEAGGERPGPDPARDRPAQRTGDSPLRTVFFRPPPGQAGPGGEATVLSEPEATMVPVRPGEFMSAAYVMDPASLTVRGTYLHPVREDRPARGAAPSAHPQDRVYLSYGDRERPAIDDRLMLVRVGRDLDGVGLADRIIEPRAIVRIVDLGRDVMQAQIESQFGPVFPGQLLIPLTPVPEFEVSAAVPVDEGSDLRGEILAFLDDQELYGPGAVAFLDLGRGHGVREGDVFRAYLPPREPEWSHAGAAGDLPREVVAELRVVRVTDAAATVQVDQVKLMRLGAGLPVARVRKMP